MIGLIRHQPEQLEDGEILLDLYTTKGTLLRITSGKFNYSYLAERDSGTNSSNFQTLLQDLLKFKSQRCQVTASVHAAAESRDYDIPGCKELIQWNKDNTWRLLYHNYGDHESNEEALQTEEEEKKAEEADEKKVLDFSSMRQQSSAPKINYQEEMAKEADKKSALQMLTGIVIFSAGMGFNILAVKFLKTDISKTMLIAKGAMLIGFIFFSWGATKWILKRRR